MNNGVICCSIVQHSAGKMLGEGKFLRVAWEECGRGNFLGKIMKKCLLPNSRRKERRNMPEERRRKGGRVGRKKERRGGCRENGEGKGG